MIMEFIGKLILEAILQVIAYWLGRSVAMLIMPTIGIEPFHKQQQEPRWNWRGFTYMKSGKRFLYTESIQLLGLAFLFLIVGGFAAMLHDVAR